MKKRGGWSPRWRRPALNVVFPTIPAEARRGVRGSAGLPVRMLASLPIRLFACFLQVGEVALGHVGRTRAARQIP
jgi:hypothetical protein